MQRICATPGLDILGNQLIDGWLILVLSESRRDDEHGGDERDYKTQMHMKFTRQISDTAAPPIFKEDGKASCYRIC
jgi:hypothetical protein